MRRRGGWILTKSVKKSESFLLVVANMPLGKFVPLGGKTGKKLGAQIDIINTLSMSMVKIFSQLLLIIPHYG